MNNAIELFYYVFFKIYDFLFNQAKFTYTNSQGQTSYVSIGWVFLVVIVFTIIIRTILSLPSGESFRSRGEGN